MASTANTKKSPAATPIATRQKRSGQKRLSVVPTAPSCSSKASMRWMRSARCVFSLLISDRSSELLESVMGFTLLVVFGLRYIVISFNVAHSEPLESAAYQVRQCDHASQACDEESQDPMHCPVDSLCH